MRSLVVPVIAIARRLHSGDMPPLTNTLRSSLIVLSVSTLLGCGPTSHDASKSDAATADGGDAATTDVGDAACDGRSAGAPKFARTVLDSTYRAEGVGVLDVNNDGHLDIVTDQVWYEGPSFSPHAIRAAVTFSTTTQYADCFGVFPRDLDGDGFQDIVVAPHVTDAMYWYRNPGGALDKLWTRNLITPAGVAGLETPYVVDLFGTGRPVLLMTDSERQLLGWYEPGKEPTQPWTIQPITSPGSSFVGWAKWTHGIGVGDVNGDGRLDVLTGSGWFGQTADRTKWDWHPVAFGPDAYNACSRMYVYDFDGDGANDVLCARPHDYGLFWFQQQRHEGADSTFVPRLIDDKLSEMHALRFEDLDGDGAPEIITGKRWLAHGDGGDPGAKDPAQLVYYAAKMLGTPSVRFEKHVIDEDSGVGGTFAIADVDGDCKPDIVTANKKGLFVFRQVGP